MCADACNQAERSALGTVQYTFRRESVNPYPMEGGGGEGNRSIYIWQADGADFIIVTQIFNIWIVAFRNTLYILIVGYLSEYNH